MQAKYLLGSLTIVGAVALATPSFAQQHRTYPGGTPAGAYGMDVAPGGGTYSRADVAAEPGDRMSHPVAGERRAPSNIVNGPLAHVDAIENAETARLNRQQLTNQTAQLPPGE